MKRIYLSLLLAFSSLAGFAQVNLTATGGTLNQSYTTLGAAFVAINAGTHTGAITITVSTNTTEVGSCVLHSGDATPANYTSVSIRPSADAVTISGPTVIGRGLIELNGADNVTIDGDNAASGGTNRNLTITNTAASTITFTSVIRVATNTNVLTANNITIRNCNINGSATAGNNSANTSATAAYATTWGIYCGGNGGASAIGDPTALSSVTANTSATTQSINTLLINNNSINNCGRGISFMGAGAAVSTGIVISNNLIGTDEVLTGNLPFISPASTVYIKGINVQGTNACTISNNTIRNIISYVAADRMGIELLSGIGTGTISISNNSITGIIQNNTSAFPSRGISVANAGAPYTIDGNTITNIQTNTTSATKANRPCGIYVATAATSATISGNKITRVYSRNPGTYGVSALWLNGGSNILVQNNFVSDVNQDITGGAAFSATFGIHGIALSTGTGHKIYHNSVYLSGVMLGTPATGILSSAFTIDVTTVTGVDVRNNIFASNMTGATTGSAAVAVTFPSATATASMNLTINNNALFSGTTASNQGIAQTGFTSSAATLFLASNFNAGAITPANNLRSYTSVLSAAGTNDNATLVFTTAPLFVSATDLHLQTVGGNTALMAGAAGTGVTTDIDGTARSGANPVIGGHEVSLANCSGAPTPGTANASIIAACGTFTTTLSTSGTTSGATGITYQWQSSLDNVPANFTNITGATNPTYVATVTTTTYYRARIGCSFSGMFAPTPGIQVVSNALPAAITGGTSTCVGGTLNLASTTPSGVWSSGNTAKATISAGGVVTGVATGAATISYTAAGCSATSVVIVNPGPAPLTITPSSLQTVCLGDNASFTASTAPTITVFSDNFNSGLANWTVDNTGSTPASAAATAWQIRSSGYVPGGGLAGTFSSPDNSQFAMVNSDAGGSGSTTVTKLISPSFSLVGYTSAALNFQNWFATWASGDVSILLEVSTNGGTSWSTLQVYTGTNVGTSSGFANSSYPLTPYVGMSDVKVRFSYHSVWGYGWALDNLSVDGVAPFTYSWTGLSGADGLSCTSCTTPTITPTMAGSNVYSVAVTANGCSSSANVTVSVNPLPVAITGNLQVCEGLTTTLANTTGGGTWTSDNTVVATIDPNTGLATGVAAGTSLISYTLTATGCRQTAILTVNLTPASIDGTKQVCAGSTTDLGNANAGGAWTSGNTSIATVDVTDGLVTGVLAGTATIMYAMPTGCSSTTTVSVNPLPVLTVTPGTPTTLCIGDNTSAYTANAVMPAFSLLYQNFNNGLGAWTVENVIGLASGQWQIVPVGFDASTTGDGTPMLQASPMVSAGQVHSRFVSPSFSTAGYTAATLSFNYFLLTDADPTVDVEYSIDGGTSWLTMQSYVGLSGGNSTWTAAAPEATIALPTGAMNQPNVKIRWNYNASFYAWFIDNVKVGAELPAATYSWTGGGDLSCTDCANPTITPTATGMNVYTVTATSNSSCSANATVSVSVNPLPAVITATSFEVCEGLTTTLSSTTADGTWTSGNTTVATVNASTGVVTGQAFGTANITYMLATGCIRFATVSVNALPSAITGVLTVCEGLTTALGSTPAGGAWTSSATGTAIVDANGLVSGIANGTATITYELPVTGCIRTAEVTVNALPSVITASSFEVCEGLTTTLSSTPAGGAWTSSATGIASVNTAGVVTGQMNGTATITYQLPVTGCIQTAEVTVNPLPAAITGVMTVCEGLTTTLSSAPAGGAWTSSDGGTASVDVDGIVTGNVNGNATITYELPVTGCIRTAEVTVNALPSVISGTLEVCEGLTTALGSTPAGGAWTSSAIGTASVNNSGVVTGHVNGNATITYELPVTGCIRTAEVTVNALPAVITGNFEVCEGLTTTLSSAPTGGAWSSSAVGTASVDVDGIVMGHVNGTATITYQLPVTGCIQTATVTVNALPSVISGNLEVCEGLTTALGSTPAGGAWTSSDVVTATVDGSGLVSGHVNGTATITYELPVTGCIRTAEVTVNPTPAAITGASQVCVASSINLASMSLGGEWNSSDDAIATVDAITGVVTGVVAGNVTITYTLPSGCIATHDVTVNALPIVYNVTGGGSYCFSGAGVNVGVDNSETGTTYNLYYGSTLVASQPGTTGSAVDFGAMFTDGVYTATATSSASCSSNMSGSATVTVVALVTPMVSLGVTPNDTVCAGTSVTFAATAINGGTAPTYAWTVNGAPVATTTATHIYTPADGDVVVVSMTSNEACPSPATVTASQTMVVVSNQNPTVTIATPNTTLCQGSTAVFGATGTFGGTAPVYTWYKNSVSTGITGSVYSYVPVNGDIITARVNSNYLCAITNNVVSNSITMKIDSVYVPIVTIAVDPGLTVAPGQHVHFTATVSRGGTSPRYQWYVNSTVIPGETSSSFGSESIKNNDSVTCFVYGTGTCSYYTFNAVKMKVTTGFVQATTSNAEFRLMPNPNTGEFTVNGTLATANDAEVALEVTDMLGQIVYRNKVLTQGGILNERVKLNNMLANGMYMLNVRSGTESKVFHFVLKQ